MAIGQNSDMGTKYAVDMSYLVKINFNLDFPLNHKHRKAFITCFKQTFNGNFTDTRHNKLSSPDSQAPQCFLHTDFNKFTNRR